MQKNDGEVSEEIKVKRVESDVEQNKIGGKETHGWGGENAFIKNSLSQINKAISQSGL